tara:strand:+ start:4506 stop:4844 length:339 start_codon:yes stop_codon:yes gene_type:complete
MKKKIAKILIPNAVVVKQKVEETKSGIILSKESTHGGSMERFDGEVIAVGDSVTTATVGDFVSFGRNSFSIKKYDGEEFFYLYEEALHTIHRNEDQAYECESNEFYIGDVHE